MVTLKQKLYNCCLEFIDKRLVTVKNTMEEIQESLLSETKSSAGDKHETGRAMLQLEREKAGNQLAEILKIKTHLSKIDVLNQSETVKPGSVVFTNKSNYFISISAGELMVDGIQFYAISQNTPIGLLLISKAVGDIVTFRDTTFVITKVL